jgi:hypothetical protein
MAAAMADGDCLRGLLSMVGVITLPGEVLADGALREKAMRVGGDWRDTPLLGPVRAGLVALATA